MGEYRRLAKGLKGVSAKFMWRFFISVAIPKMLYASELFLIPGSRTSKGTKGFISKLAKIQRQVALHITGALRSAPTDEIDACADMLPFQLLVKKLTYQVASRLATLPWSHPHEKHVNCASSRYAKSHRDQSMKSCMLSIFTLMTSKPSAHATRAQ